MKDSTQENTHLEFTPQEVERETQRIATRLCDAFTDAAIFAEKYGEEAADEATKRAEAMLLEKGIDVNDVSILDINNPEDDDQMPPL